ncbi:hypothetical protein ES703_47262 [subsurface metagenome]
MLASTRQPGISVSPGTFSGNSPSRIGKGDKSAESEPIRHLSYSMEKVKPLGRLSLLPAGLVTASIISSIWRVSISLRLPEKRGTRLFWTRKGFLRLPNNFSMEVRSRWRLRAGGNSRNPFLSKITVFPSSRAISPHNRALSPSRKARSSSARRAVRSRAAATPGL